MLGKACYNVLMRLNLLLISLCTFIFGSCGSFQPQGRYLDASNFRGPSALSSSNHGLSSSVYFPLKRFRISRGFSPHKLNHFGVDFVAPRGTPVYSSHAGKVIFAGRGFSGYGKLVVVEHPDKYASFYAHLHRINVKEGQVIYAKQQIGQVGDTGNARGVHLHYELKIGTHSVDPMKYLSKH